MPDIFKEVREWPENSGQLCAVFAYINAEAGETHERKTSYVSAQVQVLESICHNRPEYRIECEKAVQALETKKAERPDYYKLNNWWQEDADAQGLKWGRISIEEDGLEDQISLKEPY